MLGPFSKTEEGKHIDRILLANAGFVCVCVCVCVCVYLPLSQEQLLVYIFQV